MKRVGIVLLLLGACASTHEGIYLGSLPASVGGGDERRARVTLKPGGEASVQATFYEPPSRVFAEGRWREEGDRVVIELPGASPQRLVFARSGQQLAPREWDRAAWGEKGPPVLYRLLRPTITQ